MSESSINPGASALQENFEAVRQSVEASDIDRAIVLADRGLALGSNHPLLLNLSAFGSERQGRLGEALEKLRRALVLDPRDASVHTAIGQVLSQLGRDPEALPYFDSALALAPHHAPALHGKGLALSSAGRTETARDCHLRAVELAPDYPDPLGALAALALDEGDDDAAQRYADAALALDPLQTPASIVLATIERRDQPDKALTRLDAMLEQPISKLHRSAAEHLRAEILERSGQPAAAFEGHMRAKALSRSIYSVLYERADGPETGLAMCRRLEKEFEGAKNDDWRGAPGANASGGTLTHVFLLGFIRSGTTLLEQVLASHPDVVALEEKATLRAVVGPYILEPGGLDRLKHIGAEEAEAVRADYWARVESFGIAPAGKVFVDKAPLSTAYLPVVAKLFPDAKILFAVRDPRDVVASAFKHRLAVNALTWAFTDLTETAKFYDAVMRLAERYREVLPLALYEHRHENLIADFDAEVNRICDFLGLEWTEVMRDFAETAKARDIRTPSAEQVRGGLSAEGLRRWRSYGPGVEPMLPILQPWVERYGYDVA